MNLMISNAVSDPAYPPAATENTKKISKTQSPDEAARPEEPVKNRPAAPVTDEYIPERKSNVPEKSGDDKKAETCTANTDKVDREIEKLKKKQAELQKQLNSETDEIKVRRLESELAQIENELRQKDNDAYRRRHTQFSFE